MAAGLHFEKMKPKAQAEFRTFPIFHFWEEKVEEKTDV
jgi:hypothetical protein